MELVKKDGAFILRRLLACLFLISVCSGCMDRIDDVQEADGRRPLVISGSIEQECTTRADDGGFADGDCMGVFIVDYEDGQPGTLQGTGNRATNYALTYDVVSGEWKGNTTIYWKDNSTPVDVYGYYPFEVGVSEVEEYPFTVAADQSLKSDGEMSAYEQSDFLWAKSGNVQPTTNVIRLSYHHQLAGVKVILTKGTGFTDEEWNKLSRQVTVDNTLRNATINLSTGMATPIGEYDRPITMAFESDGSYRAVVVPQTVKAGENLIGITLDGRSYNYKDSAGDHTYMSGKLHKFTIQINKKADGGDFELKLVSEEIAAWENDESSHNFTLSAYVIVHVETAGTLETCLTGKGVNVEDLKNLKVTGELTESDFQFIREKMTYLSALNLEEVKMVRTNANIHSEGTVQNDIFPAGALSKVKSLRTLILPKSITCIGECALSETQLSNMLVIPNSVKQINDYALAYMPEVNLEVVLPDSLEYIGNCAFMDSKFKCNFKMPNSVYYIGRAAFANAVNFYGSFRLSDNLREINDTFEGGEIYPLLSEEQGAFYNMGHDMVGDIVIPQSLIKIPKGLFNNIGFAKGTTLTLHDGVTAIGTWAFANLKFNTPINFPASLTVIHANAFTGCQMQGNLLLSDNITFMGDGAFGGDEEWDISDGLIGDLILPKRISVINKGVFAGQNFTSVTIPETVTTIQPYAFKGLEFLKTINIGKNVDYIGYQAFSGCPNTQTVVCLNSQPPKVFDDTFEGMYFDKVILEVPEQAVELYRNTAIWNQFLNITPHRELAYNIASITCLQKGITREGVMRSEGAWKVIECPTWCSVTPMQGGDDGREEVTVSVQEMSNGNGLREGRIVFQLIGTDYTTYTDVVQYDYDYAEDTEIVLQEAKAGAEEIPLVIVGEGFEAGSIADGTYLELMKQQMEYFFSIEPYRTYRDYFTVTTTITMSASDGLLIAGTMNQTNKFNTCWDDYGLHTDMQLLKDYVKAVSQHATDLNRTTILLLVNYQGFISATLRDPWIDNCCISICTLSDDSYPYDQRGLIQHELGGHNFGYLGDESVSHFDFIRACSCPSCNALNAFNEAKSFGGFKNLSLSGSINSVPWKHLLFDSRYSNKVDVYEGGYNHLRGVFRSESQSCMDTYIPYFNAISRETIVRRIMELAGKSFDFEDFAAKDSWDGRPEE